MEFGTALREISSGAAGQSNTAAYPESTGEG